MTSAAPQRSNSPPFFIIGCVRSGTTMLRNILRLHPHLASPEETHFFRWSDPFGSPGYRHVVVKNPVLRRHRELDGISEAEFEAMLQAATSRADLCTRYMQRFVELRKPTAKRWFDKSPQNAYGAAMLAAEFPSGKFLHIVRNPVKVVASLRIGKVMKMDDLVGACSYWNEAIENLALLQRAFPKRVLTLNYEAFTASPLDGIRDVLSFVGEPFDAAHFADVVTKEVRHEEAGILTDEELAKVRSLCHIGRMTHGYGIEAEVEAERQRQATRLKRREAHAAAMAARAASTEGKPGASTRTESKAPGPQRATKPAAAGQEAKRKA